MSVGRRKGPVSNALDRDVSMKEIREKGPPLPEVRDAQKLLEAGLRESITQPLAKKLLWSEDPDKALENAGEFGDAIGLALTRFLTDPDKTSLARNVREKHGNTPKASEKDGLRLGIAVSGTPSENMALESLAGRVRKMAEDPKKRDSLLGLALNADPERLAGISYFESENAWVAGVRKMAENRDSKTLSMAENRILDNILGKPSGTAFIGEERFVSWKRQMDENPAILDVLENDKSALAGKRLVDEMLRQGILSQTDIQTITSRTPSRDETLLRFGAMLIDAHRR